MKEVKFFCERLFKDLDSLIQGRNISKLYNIIAETLDKESFKCYISYEK